MSRAQTHPELAIICRILQQASVPLATADQFDRQWTPAYLRQCFRWTDHLSALLLLLPPALDSDAEPRSAAAVVRAFLDAPLLQDAPGLMPSQEELMGPSTALRRRLLSNPGLSDSARMAVLCMDSLQPLLPLRPSRYSLSHDTVVRLWGGDSSKYCVFEQSTLTDLCCCTAVFLFWM